MAVPFCIPNSDTSEFLLLPTLVGTGCFLKHSMFEPFYRNVSNGFNFHFLNMYDVSCLFPCFLCHLCVFSIEVSPCLGPVLQVGCLFPRCWTWVLMNFRRWSLTVTNSSCCSEVQLLIFFTLFHLLSCFFFHGSCLLYCTFKVITKSPKIPLLLAYRNFHFNFRVIIYFETIFMRICFQNLALSLKRLFFARDKLTVFLSLLWVPFVFCWSVLSFVNFTVLMIAVWQIVMSLLQLYFSLLLAVCWLLWISCLFTGTLESAHWLLWNDSLGLWIGWLWVCKSNLDSQMRQVLLGRFTFLPSFFSPEFMQYCHLAGLHT